jgi:molybdopterin-containing oxidoreductase family iron-sulfur binding subunit
MKELNQDTWLGVEHLNNESDLAKMSGKEFVELPIVEQLAEEKVLDTSSNRRDFLKYLGFGLGAATLAASCEIPVRRALPYVVKPDDIVPGVANYYASSFVKGGDYCSVLVKTREGRPIKIEGNALSPITQGGTNARAQASVLDLYDTNRFIQPMRIKDGEMQEAEADALTWEAADEEVRKALQGGGTIYLISNTVLSPSAKRAIEEFKSAYNARHIIYDPISSSAILEANQADFGERVIPDYHFDKADVVVSIGADFLGTWISPVEYAADYIKNRKIDDPKKAEMSRHIQIESFMSLTGSNADSRIMIKPSEQGAAIANLYNAVAAITGGSRVSAPKLDGTAMSQIEAAAKELADSRGRSLVVAGSNNVGEQTLVNAINDLLGNYGQTLDFTHASLQRQGVDSDLQNFIKGGNASAVIFLDDVNPAFDCPDAEAFRAAVAKAKLKISCATTLNETSMLCDMILPAHHYLESWGDAEPKRGMLSLIQPTIRPLFKTRQAEESLLVWANSSNLDRSAEQPYYEYVKETWQQTAFPAQNNFQRFQAFWDNTLHDGVVMANTPASTATFGGNVSAAAAKINKPVAGEALEVALYEGIAIGGGQYANNPWLQELPEPVTRCTWGNYLQVPVEWDGNRSFVAYDNINNDELYGEADIVQLTANGADAACTAVKTFGLKSGTMAINLGYGREIVGLSGKSVGNDITKWINKDANGNYQYYTTVEYGGKVAKEEALASVQYHSSIGLEGDDNGEEIYLDEKAATTIRKGFQGSLTKRVVIRRTNLKDLNSFIYGQEHDHDGEENVYHGSADPMAADYMGLVEERKHHQKLNDYSLYPDYETEVFGQGHHWGLHVDLNACIGCGTCAVACQAENNIPVVGKKEVGRHHEMAWMRIDRYFYGDAENPNVVYQPMMCQHCDNAPCENVCPVAATPHNEEGLNQMAYNRCIGTRYCANNCPYKVRRFNWLDYTTADMWPGNEPKINGEELPFGADNLTRMVLNPDVTVRSRGVIEKCSFCVQRIQAGKLTAKREQRRLQDSDVRTACQTACPTGAITFGDRNNKEGEVYKKFESDLNYTVLEQTNVRSSVRYAVRVVNKPEWEVRYTGEHGHSHGGDGHGEEDHG